MISSIKVYGGHHRRIETPVSFTLPNLKKKEFFLIDKDSGAIIPVQVKELNGKSELSFVIPFVEPEQEKEYSLVEGEYPEDNEWIVKKSDGVLEFYLGDFHVTTYRFKDVVKPYFYPLNTPKGLSITEDGPKDHVHHRSFWTAHGDVNGVDIWSENPGHGYIRHLKFINIEAGKVYAEFTARNLWTTSRGDKLLEEVRKVRFWRTFSRNLFIDYVVTLKATFQDVLLGDTKEGGIVSFRVAPEIRVKGGRGKIENSFGGINEEESWGKRAHWCDYYGPLEGEIYGIAVFDNPTNPRHPTYWHVRNYGLMTANIFGISYFERKPGKPGNYFLKKGEKITFRYRIYIHKGSTVEANVPLKYIDYVFPPRILV